MAEPDDDDEDLRPPPARRVAERAMVLSAVIARAFIEQDGGRAGAEALRERFMDWLRDAGAETELEDKERALLATPLGRAQPQEIVDSTWQSEGLAVLAWALRRVELPAYDRQADPKAAADAVGYLDIAAARALLQEPALRPAAELEQLGNRTFALHWRLREFRLHRVAIDFAAVARDAWFGPLDLTGLVLVRSDLALGRTAISRAPEERVRLCSSIARERHRAINWLLGYHPIWSDTPTNT